MKLFIPDSGDGHYQAVPFQAALAIVVDRYKITFVSGRYAAAFAQVPVETTAQANIVLPALLNAAREIERRFKSQKGLASNPRYFFVYKLTIEVEDTAMKLWVGRKILHKIPTRTREEVDDVINSLVAAVNACEALDEIRVINEIVARARAAQASA